MEKAYFGFDGYIVICVASGIGSDELFVLDDSTTDRTIKAILAL